MTESEAAGLRRLEQLADQLAGTAEKAGFAVLLNHGQPGAAADVSETGTAESLAAAALGARASVSTTAETPTQQGKTLSSATAALANLNPLVAGLMKLLGSGREETVETLTKIERPAAIRYQGVVSQRMDWGITEMDYAADGRPRLVERAAQTPVVVQVQAMDSRSFLDHRDEIASAVRQALLESHGLGDVMREV